MAGLRHPNIVMFLGACSEPPCMVTEYCARGSLLDILMRARQSPVRALRLPTLLSWTCRAPMAYLLGSAAGSVPSCVVAHADATRRQVGMLDERQPLLGFSRQGYRSTGPPFGARQVSGVFDPGCRLTRPRQLLWGGG